MYSVFSLRSQLPASITLLQANIFPYKIALMFPIIYQEIQHFVFFIYFQLFEQHILSISLDLKQALYLFYIISTVSESEFPDPMIFE